MLGEQETNMTHLPSRFFHPRPSKSFALHRQVLVLLLAGLPLLSGCVPAIIGGGAAAGATAVREKRVADSISDTQISTQIKLKLYQKEPLLYQLVGLNVQNGEVLMTGTLEKPEDHLAAVKAAWEVKGVKRVIDEIKVSSKTLGLGSYAQDSWLTTKLKTKLLFEKDILSVNYTLKTVGKVIYIMGIAQNQAELEHVMSIAQTIGAKKVVSYVQIKNDAAND